MTSKIIPYNTGWKIRPASMDMVIELLLMTGRSLPEVMMMVVPEAWEKHKPCLMTKSILRDNLYYGALGWPCLYSVY
jgi:glutamate synthase domain-containing protein 1